MIRSICAMILGLCLGNGLLAQQQLAPSMAEKVEAAMLGEHRSESNQARNRYRHPVGTLTALGLQESMTVMEIWPGGGWYTEVLAPVMRDNGSLIVASYDTEIPDQPEYRYRLHQQLMEKFAADPANYDRVKVTRYSDPESQGLGADGSVDMVLTFRNMHGWIGDGIVDDVLADFHAVIKPGGWLGIVQHRAADGSDAEQTVPDGYVPQATVQALVEAAGFQLVSSSEVNANPADDHDHPEGVWTLPPSLELEDQDREKYLKIGESDRMTLLFRK